MTHHVNRLITIAILIATFMTSVETTIITTALPTIITHLNGLAFQSWIFAAYLITTALSTPIYGQLADQIGRKLVFITGLILFTSGSLLCGFANHIGTLILFRALQGLGAGAIMPITFTIIADLYPYDKRANVLALNNTAWGISALLGPLLGGFIVDQLSWHWIFFINVPLGAVVFTIIWFGYHEATIKLTKAGMDKQGILLLAAVLFNGLIVLQLLGNQHVNWLLTATLLVIEGGLITTFYKIECRADKPIIPIVLFQNRLFTIQIATALLLSGTQIGFQTYFPMWLQSVYHANASLAGLAVTPSPIMWLITSFSVGWLVSRWSPRQITLPLIIVQLIFYLPLIIAGTALPQLMFYLISGVSGAVMGVIITMNTLVSQHVVSEDALGTASAMLTLGRTLGQTIATGIFGLVFNIAINSQAAHATVSLQTINHYISGAQLPHEAQLNVIVLNGFHSVFALVVILFILTIGINTLSANGKRVQ